MTTTTLASQMVEIISDEMESDPEYYTGYDQQFIANVSSRLTKGYPLTERQTQYLGELWERHMKR